MKNRKFTTEEIGLLNRMVEIKGGTWPSDVWDEYRLLCAYFRERLPISLDECGGLVGVTLQDIRQARRK